MKQMQKEVEVHVYQHGISEIKDIDDLEYANYTLHDSDDEPPLPWHCFMYLRMSGCM